MALGINMFGKDKCIKGKADGDGNMWRGSVSIAFAINRTMVQDV
jgi:hypothetical protein